MKVTMLDMTWTFPGEADWGTEEPHRPITDRDCLSITEQDHEGNSISWLVEWSDGTKTRYFKAQPGIPGVHAVHYAPETSPWD
jgi:hypothetical protein